MITTTTLVHVLCAGVAGYIIGALWFSPLFFMKPWMAALNKTAEDSERAKKELPRVMAYGFLNTLALAFVLKVVIDLTQTSSLLEYMQVTLLCVFGFIVTTKFNDLIYASHEPHWSKKPQQLFLINSGYYIATSLVMVSVLWALAN